MQPQSTWTEDIGIAGFGIGCAAVGIAILYFTWSALQWLWPAKIDADRSLWDQAVIVRVCPTSTGGHQIRQMRDGSYRIQEGDGIIFQVKHVAVRDEKVC